MKRRKFIGHTAAGGAIAGGIMGLSNPQSVYATPSNYLMYTDDLVIERDVPGQPHKGKVLAVIHEHGDDIPLKCAGLTAKLTKEGYTGYLIKTTNDDTTGQTPGEGVRGNEIDGDNIAKILGLKKAINLDYRKHQLDGENEIELRARFFFLFRVLKVDTVICRDPWGHYEENPDHYATGKSVEAACWMSSNRHDYPEHLKTGIKPKSVRERYYFARGPQLVNRIIDVGSYVDQIVESNIANQTFGPAGNNGIRLRERLKKQNIRLPLLGDDDHTANYQYIKQFIMDGERKLGKKFGLEYVEAYHYIGPGVVGPGPGSDRQERIQEYIKQHGVKIR